MVLGDTWHELQQLVDFLIMPYYLLHYTLVPYIMVNSGAVQYATVCFAHGEVVHTDALPNLYMCIYIYTSIYIYIYHTMM